MSAEINTLIARYLKPTVLCDRIGGCLKVTCGPDSSCKCDRLDVPDFFTDEAANARLLEAMKPKEPSLTWNLDVEEWEVEFLDGGFREVCETVAKHADRKTAILLAFLKFANLSSKDGAR